MLGKSGREARRSWGLLKDRLKSMLFRDPAPRERRPDGLSGAPLPGRSQPSTAPAMVRSSPGLEQFLQSLRGREGLSILDFGGANQANISFITGLGHRICSEDFLRALDAVFGPDPATHSDPRRTQEFFRENLALTPESFDGALVWDSLQFLGPGLLEATVTQLHRLLRRDAYVLAFFQASEKMPEAPACSYRIAGEKSLQIVPRGTRRLGQFFNNRAIEKLFHEFQTTKFFLTRDSLREVLVKR